MSNFTPALALIDSGDGPAVIVVAGSEETERTSPPHHHARGQLLGSSRGLLSVGVEEGVWVVPAIHAVWLPPHHVHSVRSHGPFNGWGAYVAEAACRDLPRRPCTIETSGLLREALLRAGTWPLAPLSEANERVASVILDEIRQAPVQPLGLPLPRDARLQRMRVRSSPIRPTSAASRIGPDGRPPVRARSAGASSPRRASASAPGGSGRG